MHEALTTTFLVALDGAVAGSLAALLLRGAGARRSVLPFAASLLAGLALGAAGFFVARGRGFALGDVAPAAHRVTHLLGFALLAGALALRRVPAARLLGTPVRRGASELLLLVVGLLWLLPQG